MKRLLLVLAVIAVLPAAASLKFDVDIATVTNSSHYDLEFNEETSSLQEIDLVLENSGSIGCTFRVRGDFSYANTTQQRHSQPHALWPGETEDVELNFLAENYTGEVKAELYSQYCGEEQHLESFSYEMNRSVVPNRSIESVTREASDRQAELELEVEKGTAIPRETPPYWKASSARIENGSATINYEPPIYDPEETLTYTVVKEGEVVGTTQVELKEQKTYFERLKERSPRILAILLFYSVLLNTALLLDRRRTD